MIRSQVSGVEQQEYALRPYVKCGMPCTIVIGEHLHRRHTCARLSERRQRIPFKPICSTIKVGKGHHVEYKTSATDVAFIGMCRKAYGRIAGDVRLATAAISQMISGTCVI